MPNVLAGGRPFVIAGGLSTVIEKFCTAFGLKPLLAVTDPV
jgi:hypothetical protein